MLLNVLLVCHLKITEMPVLHSGCIESAESKRHSLIRKFRSATELQ